MPANPRYLPAPDTAVVHPDWARTASIYQLNTRHFTTEGTFAAARAHLPRLKELGVSILWLMPIHEIGRTKRKGTLGSPYAVKDYLSVNPEFGTVEDLKAFVDAAHELGLHVLLDWVANHTAWDNHLVTDHPEWYARDWKGDFCPTPWWDWDDIIDLDYSHPGLREYMTEALCYWVREVGIDGYRCDVAGFVPIDFWNTARATLEEIKPVFLLAEWEDRDLHVGAFDMTYAWSWNMTMHHIASGRADVTDLRVFYAWDAKAYQRDSIRMMFVANHDKNAWEGTESEQFGEMLDSAVVLSVVGKGMPLVFNGQEAGSDKRFQFFEKDLIDWREHPMGDFYRRLLVLKRDTSALWNGAWGAPMVNVPNDAESAVLSFVRQDEASKVFAVFNLSPLARGVCCREHLCHGTYRDFFSGTEVVVGDGTSLALPAWGHRLLLA
ncbi:MAG TPA: alpha-amylase family glycosyl hydrolase [Candidatus Lustribacter sp.]|nr:alpha-amylase family glycosyl hydrolase [Candidatus Lustribacter sp.]